MTVMNKKGLTLTGYGNALYYSGICPKCKHYIEFRAETVPGFSDSENIRCECGYNFGDYRVDMSYSVINYIKNKILIL